jgi:hypothetical protein
MQHPNQVGNSSVPAQAGAVKGCADQIVQALNLLAEIDQVIELRLLHATVPGRAGVHTQSGYFSDYRALAAAALEHSKSIGGAYITLNPINPALLARAVNHLRVVGKDSPLTSDSDVKRRRWLPIDLDPLRPAGISSTDEEHAVSIERAFEVRDYLREENWPDPIVADSGNGAHLLYRIDLAANDDGLVKRCLQALASRFDDDRVRIDQSVFNPSRIWKLYGTLSRKGENIPDRPHRLARILETP